MRHLLLFLLLALGLGGCARDTKPPRQLIGARMHPRTEKVWLVSNGFHTSIAIRADDAPAGYRSMDAKAKYFVIGWGGKDLYMMGSVMPWQWITSTILPTASALHVIPVRTTLLKECPNSEIIEFDISEKGSTRLAKRLRRALERDHKGMPLIVGPGKSPNSTFYGGTEVYYLPKTCNVWAAASLRTAGLPIFVPGALAADNLIWQGRKYGRLLSVYKRPGDEL